MPGGRDTEVCPCRCHYGGAVSCPGCKEMHDEADRAACPHCAGGGRRAARAPGG